MGKTKLHLLLLTGVAMVVLFVNLGGPPLWDRDEPRNAACAREMMERGDWVVPTFNAELRVLKPAMKYWLMILAYHLFGVNEFAARFWSAVFALAGAWATYFIGRRLFSPGAGLWSALILLSSLLFLMAGHLAKIDATLTFFSALALLIYVSFAFSPRPTEEGPTEGVFSTPTPSSWFVWALFYGAVGLGVLAKGLPGALPAGVLGMFLLIVRLPRLTADGGSMSWGLRYVAFLRPIAPMHFLRTFWLMRPLTALAIVLAVAGPWYFLVGVRTDGEFLRGFFLQHHLGRAMAPMENHDGPFLLYYLVTIAIGLFPWSVFLGPLLVWLVGRLRHEHPRQAACLLLSCWVGVYVVIFSFARTKLPGYITPCFPGLALLMGCLVEEICTGAHTTLRFWLKCSLATLGVIGLGLGIGVVFAARFVPGAEALCLIGLILSAGAIVAGVLVQRGRLVTAMIALMVSAVAFCGAFFGIGMVRLGAMQQQNAVCAHLHRGVQEPQLGSYGDFEPSWVFYARRPIVPLCLAPVEGTPQSRWKAQPLPAGEFFCQGPDRYILTTDKDWEHLRPVLLSEARVVAEVPRFLRKGRWLIIGALHHSQNRTLVEGGRE